MVKRKIIEIDEKKCTGCGLCIPNCKEGALQIIDNKARLVSDLFCDGLGACLGHCPEGAIKIVEREAVPYDEKKTMLENIIPAGKNTIRAHLEHLKDHNQKEYLKQALEVLKHQKSPLAISQLKLGVRGRFLSVLKNTPRPLGRRFLTENKIKNPMEENNMKEKKQLCGCPGSKMMDFSEAEAQEGSDEGKRPSQLRQWPLQLHLVSPMAPYFQEKDIVISADCVAYALGDFHKDYLKGKSLAIGCPKLDSDQEVYIEKVTSLIDDAKVNTITVMIMEVPCCGGLLHVVKEGAEKAKRKIPIKSIVVGIQGDIKSEEWVNS